MLDGAFASQRSDTGRFVHLEKEMADENGIAATRCTVLGNPDFRRLS